LKKVTLITTKQCPKCPMAKVFWRELKSEYKFEYEEIDAVTKLGQSLIEDFSKMSVPAAIVQEDGKKEMTFVGLPSRQKVIQAIEG